MLREDERRITGFFEDAPDFFAQHNPPELPKMVEIGKLRGGAMNPYGIPIPRLGGFTDIHSIVSYISGVYSSVVGKNPVTFVESWVKGGMDQILHRTLSSNGNALEWYILEMLIQTRIRERSFFGRPSRELDMQGATDLFYHNPDGLTGGGKTLGIQITAASAHTERFIEKKAQVSGVVAKLSKNSLKLFGYKRPDTMSILSVGGRIGNVVKKGGNQAFCADLGLPLDQTQNQFKQEIENESRDIAEFIRQCIHTWNDYYRNRRKYQKRQRKTITGLDGTYHFTWSYHSGNKCTVFTLRKGDTLISHFEIFDTPYQKR